MLHALLRLVIVDIRVRNDHLRRLRVSLGCCTLIEDADLEECYIGSARSQSPTTRFVRAATALSTRNSWKTPTISFARNASSLRIRAATTLRHVINLPARRPPWMVCIIHKGCYTLHYDNLVWLPKRSTRCIHQIGRLMIIPTSAMELFHRQRQLMFRVPFRLPIMMLTPYYVYCDSSFCPEHYRLKEDGAKIKCSNSGCTTYSCCDYHCEAYSRFDIAYLALSIEDLNPSSVLQGIRRKR